MPTCPVLPGSAQRRHLDSVPEQRIAAASGRALRMPEEFVPVPTNKQRRQAAQRHLQRQLERQLERRAELAKKRRRNLGLLLTALAVVVVVGAARACREPSGAAPTLAG